MKCRVFYRNPSKKWVECQIRHTDEIADDFGLSKAAEGRIKDKLNRVGTFTSRRGFKLVSIEYPTGQQTTGT